VLFFEHIDVKKRNEKRREERKEKKEKKKKKKKRRGEIEKREKERDQLLSHLSFFSHPWVSQSGMFQ